MFYYFYLTIIFREYSKQLHIGPFFLDFHCYEMILVELTKKPSLVGSTCVFNRCLLRGEHCYSLICTPGLVSIATPQCARLGW